MICKVASLISVSFCSPFELGLSLIAFARITRENKCTFRSFEYHFFFCHDSDGLESILCFCVCCLLVNCIHPRTLPSSDTKVDGHPLCVICKGFLGRWPQECTVIFELWTSPKRADDMMTLSECSLLVGGTIHFDSFKHWKGRVWDGDFDSKRSTPGSVSSALLSRSSRVTPVPQQTRHNGS